MLSYWSFQLYGDTGVYLFLRNAPHFLIILARRSKGPKCFNSMKVMYKGEDYVSPEASVLSFILQQVLLESNEPIDEGDDVPIDWLITSLWNTIF